MKDRASAKSRRIALESYFWVPNATKEVLSRFSLDLDGNFLGKVRFQVRADRLMPDFNMTDISAFVGQDFGRGD
ncbi:hypothetical protein [Litoreibacter roseus]|uniref:hypothetical protein n=1 Tax=Litoreibacter roseus TaxID=2601869 RepID=UPI00135C1758|nr:hypothetical protein [Litoreibacter roseus]